MFLDCAGHTAAKTMAHNTVCKVTNILPFCQMFVVFFACWLAKNVAQSIVRYVFLRLFLRMWMREALRKSASGIMPDALF